MRIIRSRKACWKIIIMLLTASLLWGCGFRAYEHVRTEESSSGAVSPEEQVSEKVSVDAEKPEYGNEIHISAGENAEIRIPANGSAGIRMETGTDDEPDQETQVNGASVSETRADGTPVPETSAAEGVSASEMQTDGTPGTGRMESETTEKAGNSDSSSAARILFGGDVYLSDHVLSAYRAAGGVSGVLDEGFRSCIDAAGLFFVNEEFPFSDRGTAAADKQYTFRLDPSYVRIFREMGVGGVTLANNHALDYGTEALLDSCSTLDGAGILHTGAGANLDAAKQAACYEIGGVKLAVIGASRVFPTADWAAGSNHPGMLTAYDPSVLLSEIRSLKKTQDYVIAYIHWGVEREEQPQETQKNLGRQLIDAGADLVIGAHPHVLQGIEYYQGKPIVYSLGNFVFGSSIPRTALLEVTLGGNTQAAGSGGAVSLRLIPGTSGAGYTRMLTGAAEKRSFFDDMQSISFGIRIDDEGKITDRPGS